MYPYIYLTPEKGLEFYLYLQKFNMDFSLSAVIFATANFHQKLFWGTLYLLVLLAEIIVALTIQIIS